MLVETAGGPEAAPTGSGWEAMSSRTAAPSRPDTRLIEARNEFANAFGDLARGKRNWQLVAFWALGALSMLGVAYVRLAATSRVVPYVVEVDKLGAIAAVGPADRPRTPEPRLIAAQLAAFVRAVREVLPASSPELQADVMRRAYAFVDQSAAAAATLNTYFADPAHDPRTLGQRLAREVRVTGAIPVPNSTAWKLRWTETDLPLQPGVPSRTTTWEGYVTLRLRPPTTADAIQDNPLGVYVTTIVWSEITESGGSTP